MFTKYLILNEIHDVISEPPVLNHWQHRIIDAPLSQTRLQHSFQTNHTLFMILLGRSYQV